MAYPVTSNLVIEAQMWCTDNGSQATVNTAQMRIESVAGVPTLQTVALSFCSVVAPLYRALLPSDVDFAGVSLRNITDFPKEVAFYARQATRPGLITSTSMPGQCAGLISFYSEIAGPGGRGRLYFPFLPYTKADSYDNMDAAWTDDLQVLADFLIQGNTFGSGGNSITVTWGHSRVPTDPALNWIPWVKSVAHPSIATQKRRGFYGRTNSLPSQLQ